MRLSGRLHPNSLPRLVYAGDVAVQNYCHGSSLLHRLLADIPPEKLMVIETSWIASEPERRVPGVRYLHHRPWWSRAFFSPRAARFAPLLASLAERAWRGIGHFSGDFQPDALLTVAHGFNWLGLSNWAQRRNIPLHLIVHDDWPRLRQWGAAASKKLDAIFARHYRAAASRLCVSPFMEENYRKQYGVPGRVLYPSRDAAIEAAPSPPARIMDPVQRLTVAFAGTLHPGYEKPLHSLLHALETINGRLLMFGSSDAGDLRRAGLESAALECRGLLSADALQDVLRREADVLYVPMSFDEADRPNTESSFPSKLTDYTACGLPVVIHTPPWSSAGRWARENPAAALIIDARDETALPAILRDLQNDATLRARLAEGAISAGERYFSAAAAANIFRDSLLSA